jgi:hypothetical protein
MWAKRMDSAGSRSGDTSFRGAAGARKPEFMRVHAANYGVYGARKVWLALDREGIAVARCTVGRLMAELGLTRAVRRQARCIAIADPTAPRPADFVQRWFAPSAPNRLWVQLRCVELKAFPCSANIVASCVDVAPSGFAGGLAAFVDNAHRMRGGRLSDAT